MASKYFLSALALTGSVFAQCDGDVTITTSEDAAALQSCTEEFDGTITIASEASGQLSLPSIQIITGDLIATNVSQLTSFSAPMLSQIQGDFDFEELQILSTLSMPAITGVNRIRWVALPGLQSLSFGAGVQQANEVYISNTGLTDLRGIELTAVGSMDINNNKYLKTINVNGMTNVTRSLSFSANGPNLEIAFPNLENAANLTFRNISSISMPSLAMVPGSMGFYSNSFESFAAPNLTETGNTIAFIDSPNLMNLSFPSLERIGGGLLLANNTQLEAIDGFNAVETIDGDINYYGSFSTVSFKSLTDVKGAASIFTSSDNSTICDLFTSAKDNQVIKGKVDCETSSQNVDGTGNSTGSGSGSGSKKSGAASFNPSFGTSASLTGLAALVAAGLFI